MDPLILLIEPDLDERAAAATMARAQRVYEEGARDISRVLRTRITEGTTAAGSGFDDLETKARKAYLSMQDAAEKVAREERKLESARERGSSNTEALTRRVERARLDEIGAIKRATDAYNDLDRTTSRYGATIQTAIGDGLRSVTAQFGPLGDVAESVFAGMSGKSAIAAAGIAGVGIAAVAAGKQLYDLGVEWDDVVDNMSLRTGKLGGDLEVLMGTVRDIAGGTAAPLETIGDVAARVSQSLGLTGQDLAQMTTTLSEFQAATGEAVDIRGMGKVFAQFDVNPADMTAGLDALYDASVDTGVPINDVISSMQKAGAAARGFGLDFKQTAGLVSTLEDAGVDLAKALPGMSFALRTFAQDGVAPATGLSQTIAQIRELNEAGRETEARSLAIQSFGARGYEQIYDAVVNGKLGADAFNDSLASTNSSLQDTLDGTKDLSEQWTMFTNQLKTDLAPAAETVFSGINQMIQQYLIRPLNELRDIGNLWGLLDSGAPPTIVDPRTGLPASQSNAPAGTRDSGGVRNPYGLPAGQANAPAGTRDSGGVPGAATPGAPIAPGAPAQSGWGDGRSRDGWFDPRDPAATAGTSGLPPAPSLPLQYTNTAGMASAIANATTRVDEARHDVAEKQARVNQLEQSNVATEEDLQKARNDLAKANQDQLQAERSLMDARINATEKANKQLTGLSNDMTELGDQLDADFGLSKGLGGVIENAVKAVGKALTAPLLAALGMVEKANPNEGSGLVGIAAANGMFGPQFTPAAIAASQMSGVTAAGIPAGYGAASPIYGAPAAAQPGQSARQFAHEAMLPFFESQGFTVGDHQADKYGEHQNGALDIMVDSIAEGNAIMQQVLSDPNVYGAIFNNKAYGYGQGPTPRDYSGGFTGNPTQDHQDHVHVWYQPGGSNNIVPGGGGGVAPSIPSIPPISVPSIPSAPPAPSVPLTGIAAAANTAAGVGTPIGPPSPGLAGVPTMPGGPLAGGMPSASPFGGPPAVSPASFGQPAVGLGNPYPSQGGNSGNAIGGLALDGLMAATSGLDMMMPGAGAAAKIGIQLANRTVGYAAQVGGILGSGLLETLSIGDNPKGSLGASWLGKGIGGIAGAAAALPNIAGGKPPGPMTEQGGGQAGQGGTTIDQSDRSINVKNEKASEDMTGKVIAEHQMAMSAPPGRQP